MATGQERRQDFQFHTQEGQDFSAAAAAAHLITHHSSESRSGEIICILELAGYLTNAAGPVPLVLDLRIAHDRWGSSSDPSINGHLHYPNDIDRSLNDCH